MKSTWGSGAVLTAPSDNNYGVVKRVLSKMQEGNTGI